MQAWLCRILSKFKPKAKLLASWACLSKNGIDVFIEEPSSITPNTILTKIYTNQEFELLRICYMAHDSHDVCVRCEHARGDHDGASYGLGACQTKGCRCTNFDEPFV